MRIEGETKRYYDPSTTSTTFLDNKIQSEECAAVLKARMATVMGLCLIAFANFLISSYFCHLWLSEFSLSRLTLAVVFGSLLVSVIYIYESRPYVTLDVGMLALNIPTWNLGVIEN